MKCIHTYFYIAYNEVSLHNHVFQSKTENCHVCGECFKSRNKLFEHIKATGHALRLDAARPAEEQTKKSKKAKKKGKR